LRAQRQELEDENESLKCMMSDLNDVWLQIIIDNGEDCKQAMNNKYEELTEEAESLRSAIRTYKTHETCMSAAAAFW
jgi:hypothetical protein